MLPEKNAHIAETEMTKRSSIQSSDDQNAWNGRKSATVQKGYAIHLAKALIAAGAVFLILIGGGGRNGWAASSPSSRPEHFPLLPDAQRRFEAPAPSTASPSAQKSDGDVAYQQIEQGTFITQSMGDSECKKNEIKEVMGQGKIKIILKNKTGSTYPKDLINNSANHYNDNENDYYQIDQGRSTLHEAAF